MQLLAQTSSICKKHIDDFHANTETLVSLLLLPHIMLLYAFFSCVVDRFMKYTAEKLPKSAAGHVEADVHFQKDRL